jgi:microcystin degradation protein MlrC
MSRPRCGLLGFFHEANTFAAARVDGARIEAATVRGAELIERHRGSGTVLAGYLDAADELDLDLVPLLYTDLTPSGPLTAEAFAMVADGLVDAVRSSGPWDALLLCLHGAAVSDDVADVDGELLGRLRAAVGSDVRIAVTLDLHANVTHRMVEAVDVLVGYRTNPHVDARVRAREAATVLVGCMQHNVRPTTADVGIPIAPNILTQGTNDEPMRGLLAALAEVLATPGVLTASLFEGYPYADVPDIGMRVVVSTAGDPDAAAAHAGRLARTVWRHRADFDARGVSPAEGLRRAVPGRTTLLLDVGDNIGGGAPGDGVEILRAALDSGYCSLLTIVCDSDAVQRCIAGGLGTPVDLTIGADRLRVRGTVGALSDGRYTDTGPTHIGHTFFDAGPTAVVRLAAGPVVVLSSRAVMPVSVEQLRSVGLEPRAFTAVVAKGVHSPLASYGAIADCVLQVETGGVTPTRLETLDYRRRPRPLFPFDTFTTDPVPG